MLLILGWQKVIGERTTLNAMPSTKLTYNNPKRGNQDWPPIRDDGTGELMNS